MTWVDGIIGLVCFCVGFAFLIYEQTRPKPSAAWSICLAFISVGGLAYAMWGFSG